MKEFLVSWLQVLAAVIVGGAVIWLVLLWSQPWAHPPDPREVRALEWAFSLDD